ncbi:hypothetical protein C3V43_09055 [Bacteroides heparinolyticus]|nr:hypothetical protein C3V43_09055 [Bacteroides heparinolyticus]
MFDNQCLSALKDKSPSEVVDLLLIPDQVLYNESTAVIFLKEPAWKMWNETFLWHILLLNIKTNRY